MRSKVKIYSSSESNLESVVSNLTNSLSPLPDQNNQDKIEQNNDSITTEQSIKYSFQVAEAVKKHVKKQIRYSRNSLKKKRETILIQEIFSEDLKDDSFSNWLSDELGFKSNIIFCDFLEYASKNSSQTGRKDHKLNCKS